MRIKKFVPFSCVRKSKIYLAAHQICRILKKHGFESYLVGGGVRDLLMRPNKTPKDLDIATSATVEEISRLFHNTHFVGNTFGVCLVHMNSFAFEVASFRKEGKYHDRRRPESVSYANFSQDSKRRDFTINALYYDMDKKTVIDFHDGLKDLASKNIRCVGNPHERLYEDSLRILRLCRFSADFGFKIDSQTHIAAQQHAAGISELPQERILLEWNKVKNFHFFVPILIQTVDLGFIFKNGSDFFKKNLTHQRSFRSIYSPYPLFNLINQLSLSLDMDPNQFDLFLSDIKAFPSLSKDKQLCKEYLQLILFEHRHSGSVKQNEIEQIPFMFYLEALRIQKLIADKIFEKIFENMNFFIKTPYLRQELAFLKEKVPLKKQHSPKEISEIILKHGIPINLIQTTIDFLEYTSKKGKHIGDTAAFILEHIEFIKKVAQE